MSVERWRELDRVDTLAAVHELLGQLRPRRSAPRSELVAYLRKSAAVYAKVAEIDRDHHYEALYFAGRDRERAEALEKGEEGKSPK
ncbi:hypothetical protein EV193_105396 [Herbihabitans rhizosphaerae]|uniref:Uncharacterized protein n=1 Tax=Herbihabitans rhizosphaerae TaxID=1872711 RepID=A0A4Q7KND2_9PSEU|nr:AMED_5909 family protein [Herbihabitans rhizosphaerae]RZS37836.1 hypothetical protein EV193_105396 [Herbihabitans rhizosphaerae]